MNLLKLTFLAVTSLISVNGFSQTENYFTVQIGRGNTIPATAGINYTQVRGDFGLTTSMSFLFSKEIEGSIGTVDPTSVLESTGNSDNSWVFDIGTVYRIHKNHFVSTSVGLGVQNKLNQYRNSSNSFYTKDGTRSLPLIGFGYNFIYGQGLMSLKANYISEVDYLYVTIGFGLRI